MARLLKRDFYIGAILSKFLTHNRDSKPSLIERGEDNSSQLWKMTTNTSRDFYAYMKYTTDKRDPDKRNPYNKKWQFTITDKDRSFIEKGVQENVPVVLFFLCALEDLEESEICIIKYGEYLKISDNSTLR